MCGFAVADERMEWKAAKLIIYHDLIKSLLY